MIADKKIFHLEDKYSSSQELPLIDSGNSSSENESQDSDFLPSVKKRQKKSSNLQKSPRVSLQNHSIQLTSDLDPELVAIAQGRRSGRLHFKTPGKNKSKPKEPTLSIEDLKATSLKYPDYYWKEKFLFPECEGPIQHISKQNPLELLPVSITEQGPIIGIELSDCGSMLATFSSTGSIKIWDTESFSLLKKIRDHSEENIEEFYVGQFTPDGKYILAAGKLKNRKKWSKTDDDNHILPSSLKIFDIVSGKCVARLGGHIEEIICVKKVVYNESNYWITTSQDGYIRKWPMADDWVTPSGESTVFEDGVSCMVFGVSFLPDTANRFFIAACDERVKLFDMKTSKIVKSFEQIYSSYCDCAKFIQLDESFELSLKTGDLEDSKPPQPKTKAAYFLTRGVELLDSENNSVSSIPNTVTLHKLIYPSIDDGEFILEEVKRFHHEDYLSNSWLIRISSNGNYVFAPTYNGQVFIFHIPSGKVTGILRDHQNIEVRDVKLHPFKKLLFTCSDDGVVFVYTQTSPEITNQD
ncbi:hypothetical protein BB560_004434 [Smittium megazygosporum]|uniref:Uncharacterized protein n=1 Tax=Smittium megazygosporum TaxID=133381 RepID=A0A2T9Z979_9FUNG|nr:hypothetical protein BB560_004434 [Smittium megazygosporum]